MKRKLKIALLTILTAISVFAVCLFAGCKVDYAALYNDDAGIIKRNVNSSVASVEQETLSKYSYSCSKFSGVKEIKSVTVGIGRKTEHRIGRLQTGAYGQQYRLHSYR